MQSLRCVLALIAIVAIGSCQTGLPNDFGKPLTMVRRGNWVVDGRSMFDLFGTSGDCAVTSFKRILVHDDRTGCHLCLSFDVTPVDGCEFLVRNIYITESGARREEARERLDRWLRLLEPSRAPRRVEALPTSQLDASSERLVFDDNRDLLEVHVDIARAGHQWVASAVVFRYDRSKLP